MLRSCAPALPESEYPARCQPPDAALLGLQTQPTNDYPFPDQYMFLAVHAYEREAIGDSDLAHYFRCDIVTAREIVAKAKTSREVEPSGEELQLRLDFQQSLLDSIS